MAEAWTVRRRKRRPTPMRERRGLGPRALLPAGAAIEFPGTEMPEPESARERLLAGLISLAVHAGGIGLIALLAALAPEELIEQLIEVTRLPDTASEERSAPRPKVIAESSGRYAPAPQAIAMLIHNPAVIQRRAAVVEATALRREAVSVAAAPKQVARAAVEVAQVRAYQSVASATASPVEVGAAAPVIEGPIDVQAPVGRSGGPRQVTTGSTVGIADPNALGTGSSVRDGIASNRDVFGGRTGARAQVDWEVGAGGGRGSGGDGTGPGGVSMSECRNRPEVAQYLSRVKDRVELRWNADGFEGTQEVAINFKLDPSGSALSVRLTRATIPSAGDSAIRAMRASSPFDPMSDRVRCLAGAQIVLTFESETF